MGNLRGRIWALKLTAKQNVAMDVGDGGDKDRAVAKYARAIEPRLKKLQRRLERACKAEGTSPPVTGSSQAATKKKRSKAAKKVARSTSSSEVEDDLLSKLDSL